MIDTWIAAGRFEVSPADLQLACEFLEQAGWKVEGAPLARIRIVDRQGQVAEMSREGAVMAALRDRKSTRLNSSHLVISYAVFCLKKKTKKNEICTKSA